MEWSNRPIADSMGVRLTLRLAPLRENILTPRRKDRKRKQRSILLLLFVLRRQFNNRKHRTLWITQGRKPAHLLNIHGRNKCRCTQRRRFRKGRVAIVDG